MQRNMRWLNHRTIAACGLATVLFACRSNEDLIVTVPTTFSTFTATRLVSDVPGTGASFVDPRLVNPWGLVFGPTGLLWVADNGSGVATVYAANGTPQPLFVNIPSPTLPTGGKPTGEVFNGTAQFLLNGTPAAFIFAGEDGVISAWNAGPNAILVANRSALLASYTGLAMASSGGANFLYAADFHNARIDVFNSAFGFVRSFTDPSIPIGFAPYNVQNIGGRLFVTYAKQLAPANFSPVAGVGNGFVVIFNADGTVASRFTSNGILNAPWGIALAPAGFGTLAGSILIGNFGDGTIGAYNPTTGILIDVLRDATGVPIVIDGLWGLVFGPAGSTTLYFSSGPLGETHGLLGSITPR